MKRGPKTRLILDPADIQAYRVGEATTTSLGIKYHVYPTTIRTALQRSSIRLRTRQEAHKLQINHEQRRFIRDQRNRGKSFQAIAKDLGISKQRVYQIVQKINGYRGGDSDKPA